MNENEKSARPSSVAALRRVDERRLELARKVFKDFYAQCFWSYRQDAEIGEEDIPWIIRELRHYGGARGYQAVAELCR